MGSVFTLAARYQVHPETKVAYSHLQQFTVTSATTTSVSFLPAAYSSGARQNIDSVLADDDAFVWVGAASTGYVQNLMYHKDAFTFVTADLPLMANSEKSVRQTYDGISLRCWQDSDIRNDEMLTRIDILYGFKAIRPQWACRVTS